MEKNTIGRLADVIFKRSSNNTFHPGDDGIIRILKGQGNFVNEDTSLRFSAVFSCVRVLSESVAQLPLRVYRRTENGREVAVNHHLYRLLHSAPNERQSAFSFWEATLSSLALWGNSYALIDYDKKSGAIEALWFLDPNDVSPRRTEKGDIVYDVMTKQGKKVYLWDEIFHIPGLSFDGLMGKSVIRTAHNAISQGLAASEYAGRFFENDSTPRGVLETDTFFKDDSAIQRLRKNWNEFYQGTENSHKIAILENGLKFKPLTINPEDAQLLETRKFNRTEIAGIFRVPLHMIGDLDKATFSNIEHQSIDFVKFSLTPWLRRIEQAISLQLFSSKERNKHYAEFATEGMLRGDTKSRYESYRVAIQSGWLSINEVRSLENMSPVQGGDEHYLQMQMVPIGESSKGGEKD